MRMWYLGDKARGERTDRGPTCQWSLRIYERWRRAVNRWRCLMSIEMNACERIGLRWLEEEKQARGWWRQGESGLCLSLSLLFARILIRRAASSCSCVFTHAVTSASRYSCMRIADPADIAVTLLQEQAFLAAKVRSTTTAIDWRVTQG